MIGKARITASVALAALLLAVVAPARAGVQMSTGIRYVYEGGSVDQCSQKAKSALNAYLQNATEKSPGSGEWLAYGKPNGQGQNTSAAIVRCALAPKGYVVTFTCAVQQPGSPFEADPLCLNIAHSFSGKTVTTLATPTPVPSGCSTTNLVGTWISDNNPKLVLTMDTEGGLTDPDGVSGNWYLAGTTVTLTYYGNKTLTLSADGKHMSGSGASYTRKC
ncbi:MAG TPA: hypothetical protein VFE36_16120 [Candidatus Baltobacteraceae bacterium]|nr:hypothetical protein [Candidatus Baltobacteraceae bacterium]